MKEPENHEPRDRRDGKVAEGQRREYQCTRDEQSPPSEYIGKSAGRQLQEHPVSVEAPMTKPMSDGPAPSSRAKRGRSGARQIE